MLASEIRATAPLASEPRRSCSVFPTAISRFGAAATGLRAGAFFRGLFFAAPASVAGRSAMVRSSAAASARDRQTVIRRRIPFPLWRLLQIQCENVGRWQLAVDSCVIGTANCQPSTANSLIPLRQRQSNPLAQHGGTAPRNLVPNLRPAVPPAKVREHH